MSTRCKKGSVTLSVLSLLLSISRSTKKDEDPDFSPYRIKFTTVPSKSRLAALCGFDNTDFGKKQRILLPIKANPSSRPFRGSVHSSEKCPVDSDSRYIKVFVVHEVSPVVLGITTDIRFSFCIYRSPTKFPTLIRKGDEEDFFFFRFFDCLLLCSLLELAEGIISRIYIHWTRSLFPSS